jgi:hypothetical protein
MVPVPSTFVDGDSPHEAAHLTDDDPLAGLAQWLADARVDREVEARTRRRWLDQQAREGSTMAGLLLDLAEREAPVTVRTRAGAALTGVVVALGSDFAVVRSADRGDTLVPSPAIATVRGGPGGAAEIGDRAVAMLVSIADALVELAVERPLVMASVRGEEVRGELSSSGRDVITVTLASSARDRVHIAVDALDHLVLLTR